MARKRGGLAGIWDRNKKIITPIAELAAGALGGPWAATALGSAIHGLDRPGKGGIGFDVGQGLKGGVEGFALGKAGSFAGGKLGIPQYDVGGAFKSGLGRMFGGSAPAPTVPSAPLPQATEFGDVANAGKVFGNTPIPGTPATPAPHGLLNFAKNNTNLLAGAFGALSEYPKNQAESEYAKAQAEALRRKMAWEDEDRANAQSKTDLLAKLLMGGFYGRPTVSL